MCVCVCVCVCAYVRVYMCECVRACVRVCGVCLADAVGQVPCASVWISYAFVCWSARMCEGLGASLLLCGVACASEKRLRSAPAPSSVSRSWACRSARMAICMPVCARMAVCIPVCARMAVCIPACARMAVCIPVCACMAVCIPVCACMAICMPVCARMAVCIPVYARMAMCMPVCARPVRATHVYIGVRAAQLAMAGVVLVQQSRVERKKRSVADGRVGLTNEYLLGMRVIKVCGGGGGVRSYI